MPGAPCALCGSTDGTSWCPMCKAFLCPRCWENYPKRTAHAVRHPVDTARKLIDSLTGR